MGKTPGLPIKSIMGNNRKWGGHWQEAGLASILPVGPKMELETAVKILERSRAVVAHVFNPSTWEVEAGRSL